jgi:Uma2 family endonuclease
MATIAAPVERLVRLRVSWETYQRLLAEHTDEPGTRFTYNDGDLEIMVLSASHEHPNRTLAFLVEELAGEWGIEISALGSTTFQREDLRKGFEPDSAFLIGKQFDPALVPPPDLMIEVDITRSSLIRFPVFAAFGVPEVWRYDGQRVAIFRLEGEQYVECETSPALPPLTGKIATEFLELRQRVGSVEWLRQVRVWARGARP